MAHIILERTQSQTRIFSILLNNHAIERLLRDAVTYRKALLSHMRRTCVVFVRTGLTLQTCEPSAKSIVHVGYRNCMQD